MSSDVGCLNADGLKIDHVAGVPGMYGMQYPKGSKNIRGIELLKYAYDFVYNVAKSIKPDAFITGQSPNPYFYDSFDGIRLGDAYSPQFSIVEEMKFRASIAKLALPNIILETDHWPVPNLHALVEYIKHQGEIGVPSLYYGTHIDTTGEKITPDVFRKIKKYWVKYLRSLPFHSTLLDR